MTSHKLLSNTYNSVENLEAYVFALVPNANLQVAENHASFVKLLETCLVARSRSSPEVELEFQYYQATQSQSELIKRAQLKLLKSRDRANVLVLGYRLADDRDDAADHLVNWTVNTNIESLRTADWKLLLERIGDGPMFHLLTTCSIFLPVANDCYVQVAGQPISELVATTLPREAPPTRQKRILEHAELDRSTKRSRPDKRTRDRQINTASDISVARNRIFYGKAQHTKSGRVILGFPPGHILYRVQPERRKDSTADAIAKGLQASSRHLSKYIFPRQYDLQNPFTCEKDKKSMYNFPSYENREDEILNKGPVKTPKRLKLAVVLLEKMITLYDKAIYNKLCHFTCPSKVTPGAPPDILEPNPILGNLPLNPEALATQAVVSPSNRPRISTEGLLTDKGNTSMKAKPRFTEFSCSHAEVYRFVASVILTVVPRAMWGSQRNLKVILSSVSKFISCRRLETLTLHNILQGFCVADCDWLSLESGRPSQQRVSWSSDLKRRGLLEEFLYWFFEGFIVPLLGTTFYITESSAFKNQVLYFRQDDWTKLCAPSLSRLSESTFELLHFNESQAQVILRTRKLGYSHIRLLPKESGVRPIVNLRRKPKSGQSINQVLQNAFQILTFEKNNRSDLLGASVFGLSEVYAQLKAYRSRIMKLDRRMPRLYFVKVDVRAAFDTIDQGKLLDIVQELLSSDNYSVRRWAQVVPATTANGGAKRMFRKEAGPQWDQPKFFDFAQKLADMMGSAIFVDGVAYGSAEREEILRLLEEHITRNLVKIGTSFYNQKVGIPQGSVLSTLLCSFFYGDLERKKFDFRKDPRNLLLRYVDDYLFVTTKVSMARKFLALMSQGHPEYGCFISTDKTLTNFEDDIYHPQATLAHQPDFPWCGIRINMETLRVQGDYYRLHDVHVSTTLTVNKGRNPGAAFIQKMIHATKLRNHLIYNDTSLNGRRVVYVNIYQSFALAAMKMHGYLRSWGIEGGMNTKWRFILNTIARCIHSAYASVRRKMQSRLARDAGAAFSAERTSIVWLGYHAFHTVLAKKRTTYAVLLKELEKCMGQFGPKLKIQGMQLKGSIAVAWSSGLKELKY